MNIRPISFNYNYNYMDKQESPSDFVLTPVRYNYLHDLEFDIIADTIRSKNLKNQMGSKLSQLKKNINNFINGNNS